MKTTYIKLFISAYSVLLLVSCKKFVETSLPANQITTAAVFADSTDANAALIGIYETMSGPLAMGGGELTLYPGLSADELYQTGSNTDYNQFYVNNILTSNSTNNGIWTSAYNYIYTANACIDGASKIAGISTTGKNQFIAEARFIRAFVYFNLVNLYGGVPLATTTDYNLNRVLPRSTPGQVYAQIISDLQFSEANLNGIAAANDRPTSFAASALLAKVYLYNSKYDLAQAEASKVINSGNFNLEADLNDVFLAASTETIWQLDPVYPGRATWEGYYFVPSSANALPKYVLTQGLYNSFETGDQRQVKWINVNTVSANTYPYPYKYKQAAVTTTVNEDYVMLRLADLYLVRAEAEADQGDLSAALTDINVIRNRAGLLNSSASDKAAVLSAVYNERRHEFFCELGSRWFDLKRWNQATAVLGPVKTNWNGNAALYPVPILQMNANPYLIQNPGY